MFENKKLLVVGGLLLMFLGFVSAWTIGQSVTQEQINGLTEAQIRSQVQYTEVSYKISYNTIDFYLTIPTVVFLGNGEYEIMEWTYVKSFDKQEIKDCISDYNKSYCKTEWVKPELISFGKTNRNFEIDKILDYQDYEQDLTAEDLNNLVSINELNEDD